MTWAGLVASFWPPSYFGSKRDLGSAAQRHATIVHLAVCRMEQRDLGMLRSFALIVLPGGRARSVRAASPLRNVSGRYALDAGTRPRPRVPQRPAPARSGSGRCALLASPAQKPLARRRSCSARDTGHAVAIACLEGKCRIGRLGCAASLSVSVSPSPSLPPSLLQDTLL